MHPKPTAVHVREKRHRLLLPHFVFSYNFFLVLLPTEFLRAPSARRGTPMDLSRVGLTYRREGQISRHWWQSDKYSIGASMKFISPCINIPNAAILLRLPVWCNVAVYPVWHNILCSIFCTIFLIGLRKEY